MPRLSAKVRQRGPAGFEIARSSSPRAGTTPRLVNLDPRPPPPAPDRARGNNCVRPRPHPSIHIHRAKLLSRATRLSPVSKPCADAFSSNGGRERLVRTLCRVIPAPGPPPPPSIFAAGRTRPPPSSVCLLVVVYMKPMFSSPMRFALGTFDVVEGDAGGARGPTAHAVHLLAALDARHALLQQHQGDAAHARARRTEALGPLVLRRHRSRLFVGNGEPGG